jgi:hypothetical protein
MTEDIGPLSTQVILSDLKIPVPEKISQALSLIEFKDDNHRKKLFP